MENESLPAFLLNQSKISYNLGVDGDVDANFRENAILRILELGKDRIIIGRTVIPFAWSPDFNIINYCNYGFLYCTNVTKNNSICLFSHNIGTIKGLTADAGDEIVFYGVYNTKL